jgi:tRNA A37 threonylcarbamoyladenosine synthetase subunit TsaC/SUA5/YrdC
LALAALGCASRPKPRTAIIPCFGTRTLTVRNGSKSQLEIYTVNIDGTQKAMLDIAQPGLSTFVLPSTAGTAFVAQYVSPLRRANAGKIVATSTPIGNDPQVYSSLVTFGLRCT